MTAQSTSAMRQIMTRRDLARLLVRVSLKSLAAAFFLSLVAGTWLAAVRFAEFWPRYPLPIVGWDAARSIGPVFFISLAILPTVIGRWLLESADRSPAQRLILGAMFIVTLAFSVYFVAGMLLLRPHGVLAFDIVGLTSVAAWTVIVLLGALFPPLLSKSDRLSAGRSSTHRELPSSAIPISEPRRHVLQANELLAQLEKIVAAAESPTTGPGPFVGPDGTLRTSMAELAKTVGLGKTTIYRRLQELARAGALEVCSTRTETLIRLSKQIEEHNP